ncbi:MAG: DUF167 domain-containing protein [Thermoplasmata archaeon]
MIINVKVKEGNKPIEQKDGYLIVYTNEPREENKANKDIIKQLAKFYKKDFREIRIIRGGRSRDKVIEID